MWELGRDEYFADFLAAAALCYTAWTGGD